MWYVLRMRKNPDHLNDYEQGSRGITVRLTIPLKNVEHLRRVAEALRGLAAQLDYLGRFRDERPTLTLGEARSAVRNADRKLREIRGRGRPPKKPTARWVY